LGIARFIAPLQGAEFLSNVIQGWRDPVAYPWLLSATALRLVDQRNPTPAFSWGARTEFTLKEKGYLRSMLSRYQLQGFIGDAAFQQKSFVR